MLLCLRTIPRRSRGVDADPERWHVVAAAAARARALELRSCGVDATPKRWRVVAAARPSSGSSRFGKTAAPATRTDDEALASRGAGALVADRHWVAAFGRAPPLTVVARIHGRRRHFYEDVERTGRRHVARFDCDFRGHEIFGRFDTDEALHRRRRRCDRSHLWRVSGLVNPRGCNARVCARVLEAMRLNATRLKG